MVGWTTRLPSSNFAAKMELTVLFNWLNELSHDLPEITGKTHAKFGTDPKETVAGYWKQTFILYI